MRISRGGVSPPDRPRTQICAPLTRRSSARSARPRSPGRVRGFAVPQPFRARRGQEITRLLAGETQELGFLEAERAHSGPAYRALKIRPVRRPAPKRLFRSLAAVGRPPSERRPRATGRPGQFAAGERSARDPHAQRELSLPQRPNQIHRSPHAPLRRAVIPLHSPILTRFGDATAAAFRPKVRTEVQGPSSGASSRASPTDHTLRYPAVQQLRFISRRAGKPTFRARAPHVPATNSTGFSTTPCPQPQSTRLSLLVLDPEHSTAQFLSFSALGPLRFRPRSTAATTRSGSSQSNSATDIPRSSFRQMVRHSR